MKTLLIIGGLFHIALFVFHIFFWKLFNWKTQLPKLSDLNASVMPVMNLILMAAMLLFAYLSLVHTNELLSSGLGRSVLIGISAIWLFRAVLQIPYFGLNTLRSVILFAIFLAASIVYFLPAVART